MLRLTSLAAVLAGLLLTTSAQATRIDASTYGYPISNPFEATISGTPPDLRPSLPADEDIDLRIEADQLTRNDQVKFVICSREDYDWAVSKLIEYRLEQRAGEVLFSPSHQQLDARALADWIVADNLSVRLQLQLHKILWNDEPGH